MAAVTHFPISIIVEETALGTVMKLLHKTPGVVRFNVDMDHLGKKSAVNGAGAPVKRVADLMTATLAKIGKGSFSRREVMQFSVDAGGSVSGSNGAYSRLLAAKFIAKAPGGKVKATAKGEARLKDRLESGYRQSV